MLVHTHFGGENLLIYNMIKERKKEKRKKNYVIQS